MKVFLKNFIPAAIVAAALVSCGSEPKEPERPGKQDPDPEYPESVIASIGLSTDDISSISISSGSKIIALNDVLVDSTGMTVLETAGEKAVLMIPVQGTAFGKGTYRLRLRTAGFGSKMNLTFLRASDDAVATLEVDPKSKKLEGDAVDFGNIDSNLSWTPTTKVRVEFVNSSVFTNPFVSPKTFSKTYNSPTRASELVTADNLVFGCSVSKGFVQHDSYGFRVCVKDGDSIVLPRINGLTPAAFRTTTVKVHESYGYCPVNAGVEGYYTSIPDGEGRSFCWTFQKGDAALGFSNPVGDDFAEFRSGKWEILYTGTALPSVTSVSTAPATGVSTSSAVLNGNFLSYRSEASSSFKCGFEYKTDGGQWQNIEGIPSGFDFSATLTGLEQGRTYTVRAWASDSGNKIYGDEVSVTAASSDPDTSLKVLGIGNSWTRDSYRYISGIVKSAGVSAVIAHAYLGGSGLEDQFHGIDDLNYSYSHNGQQVVHSTYQYWLYDGTDDPRKTPVDDDYGNGSKGTGVTLESILKDKDWDIITFQPSPTFVSKMARYMGEESSDPATFSMARFVEKVKSLLPADVAAKVKIGLVVPWSYPTGCTSHSSFVYTWNGGSSPSGQSGWDRCFDVLHAGIQDNAKILAGGMGAPCDYFFNVGKAIYFGRQNETLLPCGYKLQREQDNTHLAEGVSKYLASLMYVYEIFGLTPEQISFCPSTYDFSKTRAEVAREVAWAAWKGDKPVEVSSVSTVKPEIAGSGSATLKGSFLGKYPDSAKDFTCGFEYKEGDGEWKVITMDEPFYEFSYNLSGLESGKTYTVRAWAACAAGKKYGSEQTLNLAGGEYKLELKPTVNDFKTQNGGIPGSKDYPVTGEDPGQEKFADRKFVYTHPDTGLQYDFYFYGKGPQMYSSSKYYLYFAYTSGEFIFGKAGSYIKLPAVPGMRLESVTLTCSDSAKSWGIAATLDQIADRAGIAGGEKHQFNADSYTFKLVDTAVNTSYYIFSASGTAKVQLTSIVYSE